VVVRPEGGAVATIRIPLSRAWIAEDPGKALPMIPDTGQYSIVPQ
jgi:hypothetical protein